MLRFLTAGESHGQALVMTLDGMPAGLEIDIDALNAQLRRRQGGYGRGRRMQIESDRAEIIAGVRHGRHDRRADRSADSQSRLGELAADDVRRARDAGGRDRSETCLTSHGRDLDTPTSPARSSTATTDVRDVLERASARETAARVAAGSLARQLLGRFGVRIASHVSAIGGSRCRTHGRSPSTKRRRSPDDSPLRCVDDGAAADR